MAAVGDVFDTADLDAGVLHDGFDVADRVRRGCVGFDGDAGFWGVDGAGAAVQVDAGGGSADVGGAEVEGLAGDVDLDGVEEFAVENFDADDMGVFGRDELLDESGGVQAELECVFRAGLGGDGGAELREAVETLDAGAGAADVGLDDDGPAKALGGVSRLRSPVDDASLGVRDAELVHQRELAGFRKLGAEGLEAVEDFDAASFEVLEEPEGVENLVAVVAIPGGRRHAIEDEGVLLLRMVFGGVEVVGGVELDVRCAATVELGEERLEPVRLLVIDGDRECVWHRLIGYDVWQGCADA